MIHLEEDDRCLELLNSTRMESQCYENVDILDGPLETLQVKYFSIHENFASAMINVK